METLPKAALYGQVRVGRVSAVGKSRHTVEVKFEEVDGFVSWDLHVLARNPGDYALPAADTPVLCLLLEGRLGVGFVLGCIYTEDDVPPLDDEGMRSIAGDDLRLGDPEAEDKVALAPKCKGNFDDIKSHFDAVWAVLTGPVINEAGMGGPSSLQAALKGAINGSPYPTPDDPAAENVSAK